MSVIDDYEERRRLRRSRARWRFVAVIAVVVGIVAAIVHGRPAPVTDHIARYSLAGVIMDDPVRTRLLKSIEEEDRAKALILQIDSPGGTVVGSEALYEHLRRIAEKKPVIATIGEVAASGGYIAALAADRIVSRGNSITGSVGVIFQMPNAHELLDRIGVSMVEVKSGTLKAEPTPYSPVPPEAIEAERLLVEDSFDWFLGLVRERRGLEEEGIAKISDGRVFTGRMAQEIGLVDAIGAEEEARDWLSAVKEIDRDLEIVDYTVDEDEFDPLDLVLGSSGLAERVGRTLGSYTESGLWALHR